MKVSLFITCLTDTFYPRVGEAVVRVLEHLGCEVDFPADQTCCGQPMFNSGYHEEARALARRMMRVFDDSERIVTPSGSCCAMAREHTPELLGEGAAVQRLVEKTREFVEFLVHDLEVDPRALGCRWEGRVTYHYSCHGRGLGMTDEVVQLLERIEGLEHVPLDKREQCCGFGGIFAVKYPEISGAMVRDKVQCLEQSEAPVVVSNDGGCTLNMDGACHRERVPVRFKHTAEILAESLGLMPRTDHATLHAAV